MATKKARTRQKKTKSRPQGRLLFILLALASLAGFGYFLYLHAPPSPPAETPSATNNAPSATPQPPAEEPLTTPSPPASLPPKSTRPPAATIPPPEATPATPAELTADRAVATPPASAPRAHKKPMVAIIIDDMGYQPAADQKMLNLPLNLSFAFLPFGPHTKDMAAAAQRKKRDILLHLPLEATNHKINPGPGTLTVAMNEQELQKKFAEDLAAVPMAIGVNNHMGSLFTEQRPAMTTLLKEVKQRGIFFLDSRTSANSVACAVAKELDVPCLSRQVFLDNDQTQAAVGKQLDTLLALARKKGWAIGIGHPHPATLAALKDRQQTLTKQVELVGIGALTRTHAR